MTICLYDISFCRDLPRETFRTLDCMAGVDELRIA